MSETLNNPSAPIASEPTSGNENSSTIQYYEIHYYLNGNEVTQNWGSVKDYDTIDNTLLPVVKDGNRKVAWYWDPNFTDLVEIGDATKTGEHSTNGWTSIILIYGRYEEEPMKVLDENGVKILFDLLSLQDYPNNDVLMAVINAIDATKLDKNNIFIGTKDEYDNAFRANKVPVGAIVVLTDIEC